MPQIEEEEEEESHTEARRHGGKRKGRVHAEAQRCRGAKMGA
jgi:hypothetical protein